MAQKTIPELQASTVVDSNSLFIVDSGIQTFKVTATDVASGLQKLFTNPIAVSTSAQLTSALALCLTNGGGLIQILQGFTVSTSMSVPANTKILGCKGSVVLAIATGGSFTIANGAQLEDLFFSTALNDATSLILLSGNYAVIRGCRFSPVAGNSITCIKVTGNSNKIHNCVFSGVVGQPSTNGIEYSTGSDNSDLDSVFLS